MIKMIYQMKMIFHNLLVMLLLTLAVSGKEFPATAPQTLPTAQVHIEPHIDCRKVPKGGCSICGEGLCVQSPDAIFAFPGTSPVLCSVFQSDGYAGKLPSGLPLDFCPSLPDLVNVQCDCGSTGAVVVPVTPFPSRAPSPIAPFTVAPFAPSPITIGPPSAVWPVVAPQAFQSPVIPMVPSPTTVNTTPPNTRDFEGGQEEESFYPIAVKAAKTSKPHPTDNILMGREWDKKVIGRERV